MARYPTWKKEAFKNFEETQSELSDDHEIVSFSKYHYRIDGKIDVWPSSKKYRKDGIIRKYGSLKEIFT